MTDIPHIKRFEEYAIGNHPLRSPEEQAIQVCVTMLNDLAEHIERLERRLESHQHELLDPYASDGLTDIQIPASWTDTVPGKRGGSTDDPEPEGRTGTPG